MPNQKDNNLYRIVLTGGHAGTTAISVVEEIVNQKKNWELYWIGPKKAFEGKSGSSYHTELFPKFGVKYRTIFTGRLQRKLSIWTIPSLLKIPVGFVNAFILLIKINPQAVVSFGGYIALPVVVAAWILRKPILIHEQTVAVGLANKISGVFAKKIALARLDSEEFFSKDKTILVGNPISSQIKHIKPKGKIGNPPVIYVTGGSSGSQTINHVIDEGLSKLTENFYVIHQTGPLDFDHFNQKKRRNYEVHEFIDPTKIGNVFEKADIVISRAGANTVAEIIQTQRPSILIPIPWTRYDEQTKNANLAAKIGVAKIINQDEFTSSKLLETIEEVLKDWKKMASATGEIAELDRNAAFRLVSIIDTLIG